MISFPIKKDSFIPKFSIKEDYTMKFITYPDSLCVFSINEDFSLGLLLSVWLYDDKTRILWDDNNTILKEELLCKE